MKSGVASRTVKWIGVTVLISLFYGLFVSGDSAHVAVSNLSFMGAIIFMIIGCFRITQAFRFYDLLSFGVKKLWEIINTLHYQKSDSKVGEYYQYYSSQTYDKPIAEFIAAGGILLLFSFVTGVMI
ncbi:DUF3899 domain-containing protein [Fusibacter ferrireducens]|uniref:DUF3899 domain-containing protein n=1 Tax=Fusibacter ferrireducens TaxID=2785058 RepID=A0ABR9ZVE9_9FIRM|nr:DUF3899 domain-containing protein [Fusibacter ferrireducens]MBF4694436.1 DUF3899 domain-containing protein [Fusibacter ferrireducens]